MTSVLLLGSTGKIGRLVLQNLLNQLPSDDNITEVRAIVRSKSRLLQVLAEKGDNDDEVPSVITEENLPSRLKVVEGSFLDASQEEAESMLDGIDVVVSTLGHNGVYGHPRRLCRDSVAKVYETVRSKSSSSPVRLIVINTAGANHPDGSEDPKRSRMERFLLWLIRNLVPPHADNEETVSYLWNEIGPENERLEFVAVRPDFFVEGAVGEYNLHERLTSGLFDGNQSTMANIADFMTKLVVDRNVWNQWKGKMPQILDVKKQEA